MSNQKPAIRFMAKALFNSYNLKNYPSLEDGTVVNGYYVFCRGAHYILQDYNVNGYDERWETADFVEIDPQTLQVDKDPESKFKLKPELLATDKDINDDFMDDLLKKIPFESALQVTNEMAFIRLISELGFRESKMWSSDEIAMLHKTVELAKKLTNQQIQEIAQYLTSKVMPFSFDAREIMQLINDYWKFDDNQHPMSSWHDKQDLLDKVRSLILSKNTEVK